MRKLLIALLCVALAGGATALLYTGGDDDANVPNVPDIAAVREGDMRKLAILATPTPSPDTPFMGADGTEMTLAAYRDKIVVLNFWATWCAPCRKEMPHLSQLQAQLGGDDFEVVTIATGRNPLPGMQRFFEEIGVDNLPLHTDPRQTLARDMGVLGLPVTLILDRHGNEIARMQGDADWSSESAITILQTLIDQTG